MNVTRLAKEPRENFKSDVQRERRKLAENIFKRARNACRLLGKPTEEQNQTFDKMLG